MSWFLKAQAVADLRDIPVGMTQHNLRGNPLSNMLTSGFSSSLFNSPGKMVYMNK